MEVTSTLRLADGTTTNRGRVEIYHEGQWGTLCDDDWDSTEAAVVCRQLGFSGVVSFDGGVTEYGQGEGPILSAIDCTGTESSVEECTWEVWDTIICGHSEDVGVTCQAGMLDGLASTNRTILPCVLVFYNVEPLHRFSISKML